MHEKAIQSTVNSGLPASSRRSLAEAVAQTHCASCGKSVGVKERAVVVVDGEPRVFHVDCSLDGRSDVRQAQLERKVAAMRRRR